MAVFDKNTEGPGEPEYKMNYKYNSSKRESRGWQNPSRRNVHRRILEETSPNRTMTLTVCDSVTLSQ